MVKWLIVGEFAERGVFKHYGKIVECKFEDIEAECEKLMKEIDVICGDSKNWTTRIDRYYRDIQMIE